MTHSKLLKEISHQAIQEFIKEWVSEMLTKHGFSYLDQLVREGYCADLAAVIWEHFGGNPELEFGNSDSPVHTWIIFRGRHFDMQCPIGVLTQSEMPYFI